MTQNKKLKEIIQKTPNFPGVYKMLNEKNKIIYIGKAKNLQKRIKQYFQSNYNHSTRTKKLIENISNIETISVKTELEAMILENNLIKEFQPKYNILMKDDKNFVYIKITKEEFPRIQIVRKIEKDEAKYIGPKTTANKVKETLNVLKKIFPFRHCNLNIETSQNSEKSIKKPLKVKITNKTIKYPCLHYYIKKCIAPCIGNCTIEEYKIIIENIEKFLNGKPENILKNLYSTMQKKAEEKKFEEAGKIRDKIKKIEEILEKQIISTPNNENQDVINYCITNNKAYFTLFQIREGKLINQENFILDALEMENENNIEVLEAFLKQYYQIATDIPKKIIIPHQIENKIGTFLQKISNKKLEFIIPQKGDKNKLLEMASNNARIFADRNKPSWQTDSNLNKNAIKELQKLLKLKNIPKRIECYDISHLSGTNTVGSMIVFQNGAPQKEMYRKFSIRTVKDKPDDYKSIEEVLFRRFSKIALKIINKDLKIRKVGKKDKKFIEKHNKIDFSKTKRKFFILEKTKKQIGFISITNHSEKIIELSNLFIKKEERGGKKGFLLLKQGINKIQNKRIYGFIKEELLDYYNLFGFEEIKSIPKELNKRFKELKKEKPTIIPIVYDKNKHKEDKSFNQIPDLIIIDGGKGQLNIATNVFEKLKIIPSKNKISPIPYISLAKRNEEIYTTKSSNPIILEKTNETLKLIQRARNEAHRFAITYQKKLRKFK